MKKFIIALMCATVSVAAMAQPQKDNQKCDKPMCCQENKACCQDGCCQEGKACCQQKCCQDGCCQEGKACCQQMCCLDGCCQQMCCGIDSTTMKTVMELKKKYRENYRKELRQTLGDEKYIQYLEYKVFKQQRKAMRKGMKQYKGMRRGMGPQGGGQWGMPGQQRMMHPGFQGRGHGHGQKFEGGVKKDDFKGNKDKDKNKDKNKDKKKDNKKKDNK